MTNTNMNFPSGIILLSQAEQLRLSPEDMFGALPPEYSGLPKFRVEIDIVDLTREAIRTRDFGPARRALVQMVRERLDPLRKQYSDYRIVYLGSASIPLTVLLGFLLETWHQIEIVPHHHARRVWRWVNDVEVPARLAETNFPDYRDRTVGEAVIRVSTSHRGDRVVCRSRTARGNRYIARTSGRGGVCVLRVGNV